MIIIYVEIKGLQNNLHENTSASDFWHPENTVKKYERQIIIQIISSRIPVKKYERQTYNPDYFQRPPTTINSPFHFGRPRFDSGVLRVILQLCC